MSEGQPSVDASVSTRIRECSPHEVGLLAEIDLSANPVFAHWGHPEFASEYDSVPAEVALDAMSEGRLLACDLVDSDQFSELIGWLIMFDRPNGETSIWQISIHASHMGRGFGRPLLEAAIDRCKRVQRRAIVLNTQTDVPWNRPWYERFGFVVVPLEAWDEEMHTAAREQAEGGLDWSTRVHMRLDLL